MRKLFLLLLLTTSVLGSAVAQSQPEGYSFVFQFVEGKDMFFSPYKENKIGLEEFVELIEKNRSDLSCGNMYIHVASYGTIPNEGQSAREVAHIQRNRVKSALIQKGYATEFMFATSKFNAEPYGEEELRNVVVLTIPASIEKIREILGDDFADKIISHNRLVKAREELKAVKDEVAARAEERAAMIDETPKSVKPATYEIEVEEESTAATGNISMRANLLYWAGGLMNLGFEFKNPESRFGLLINGGYSFMGNTEWKNNMGGWFVAPEVRYYLGTEHRLFLGVQFLASGYNYKMSETGYQGDFIGGGLTGGYKLTLSKTFDLDFSLGLGYGTAKYDSYRQTDDKVNVYIDRAVKKSLFVPIQAGISLIWKL